MNEVKVNICSSNLCNVSYRIYKPFGPISKNIGQTERKEEELRNKHKNKKVNKFIPEYAHV
jgi:hypothetical protein